MGLVSITPDMTIRMTVPGHDGLSSHGPAEEKMMTAVSQEESRARIALSVVMIAKNEAAVIGDAIRSARFADEVVVLDNGSTDRACEIARELGAVVHTGEWLGFGAQKNKAVSLWRAMTGCSFWTVTSGSHPNCSRRLPRSCRIPPAVPTGWPG